MSTPRQSHFLRIALSLIIAGRASATESESNSHHNTHQHSHHYHNDYDSGSGSHHQHAYHERSSHHERSHHERSHLERSHHQMQQSHHLSEWEDEFRRGGEYDAAYHSHHNHDSHSHHRHRDHRDDYMSDSGYMNDDFGNDRYADSRQSSRDRSNHRDYHSGTNQMSLIETEILPNGAVRIDRLVGDERQNEQHHAEGNNDDDSEPENLDAKEENYENQGEETLSEKLRRMRALEIERENSEMDEEWVGGDGRDEGRNRDVDEDDNSNTNAINANRRKKRNDNFKGRRDRLSTQSGSDGRENSGEGEYLNNNSGRNRDDDSESPGGIKWREESREASRERDEDYSSDGHHGHHHGHRSESGYDHHDDHSGYDDDGNTINRADHDDNQNKHMSRKERRDEETPKHTKMSSENQNIDHQKGMLGKAEKDDLTDSNTETVGNKNDHESNTETVGNKDDIKNINKSSGTSDHPVNSKQNKDSTSTITEKSNSDSGQSRAKPLAAGHTQAEVDSSNTPDSNPPADEKQCVAQQNELISGIVNGPVEGVTKRALQNVDSVFTAAEAGMLTPKQISEFGVLTLEMDNMLLLDTQNWLKSSWLGRNRENNDSKGIDKKTEGLKSQTAATSASDAKIQKTQISGDKSSDGSDLLSHDKSLDCRSVVKELVAKFNVSGMSGIAELKGEMANIFQKRSTLELTSAPFTGTQVAASRQTLTNWIVTLSGGAIDRLKVANEKHAASESEATWANAVQKCACEGKGGSSSISSSSGSNSSATSSETSTESSSAATTRPEAGKEDRVAVRTPAKDKNSTTDIENTTSRDTDSHDGEMNTKSEVTTRDTDGHDDINKIGGQVDKDHDNSINERDDKHNRDANERDERDNNNERDDRRDDNDREDDSKSDEQKLQRYSGRSDRRRDREGDRDDDRAGDRDHDREFDSRAEDSFGEFDKRGANSDSPTAADEQQEQQQDTGRDDRDYDDRDYDSRDSRDYRDAHDSGDFRDSRDSPEVVERY